MTAPATEGSIEGHVPVGDLLPKLEEHRRVIGVELRGHGHTRDVDRPFTWEAFGDDLAALIEALEPGPADLLGYSLGRGGTRRGVPSPRTSTRTRR